MGFLASFLSAVFSSSKDLISKRLALRLDGTSSTFASFYFALPFYGIVLAVLGLTGHEAFEISGAFLLLVLLRSVTDTFAEGMKMHAFAHGDISLVATFLSISPLFLLVTSPLITGDQWSVVEALAVVVVVGGSLLIVYRPSQHDWKSQKKGILLAIGASLFFSLNSCFDRLAVQKGTPVFAGFAMTLLSAFFLFPAVLGRHERVESIRLHRNGLLLRGVLEVAFMVSKLYALQYWQAPSVAGVQRLSLLLSILGGRLFFKEGDFHRRLFAGALIVGGAILITWYES